MNKIIIEIFFLFLIKFSNSIEANFDFKISKIHDLIKTGTKCIDIVEYFNKRAYAYNPSLNAIISFNPNSNKEAIELDKYFTENKKLKGKLHCVPVLVKDNIDIAGLPTTAGIKALRYSIPNKDSLVVSRLRKEGAIFIAKTNLAELANGLRYESELGGVCKNPYDLDRSCGVSSSGTGAGIASGMGIIGLGTDTSGSIIFPSSFNGLYGLRTSVDLSKMDGIIPAFDKQDTTGPMTKHLDDLVLALSVMNDNRSLYEAYLKDDATSQFKIGTITDFNSYLKLRLSIGDVEYKVDDVIKKEMTKTINNFNSLALNITEFSLNQSQIDVLKELCEFLISNDCSKYCLKYSMNKYFNDSDRFSYDAPYKDFEALVKSPLLKSYWAKELNVSNIQDPLNGCTVNCKRYDEVRQKSIDFFEYFFKDKIDAILMPSFSVLPNLNSQNEIVASSFITVSPFYSIAGLTALNMPISFSPVNSSQLDGLPIGVLLLTKSDNLINTLKIAKAYEKYVKMVRLPSSAPYILNSNCEKNIALKLNSNFKIFLGILALIINY